MRVLRLLMKQKTLRSFFCKDKANEVEEVLPKIESKKPTISEKKHRIVHTQPLDKVPSKNQTETIRAHTTPDKYNPSKENYHGINDACWSENDSVPFMALCQAFLAIESISARLKMISILTNYFHSVLRLTNKDLVPSIYLCLNQIGPSYEGKELGIGEGALISVLANSTGKKSEYIKKEMNKFSDLGILAENCRTSQNTMFKHTPLNVSDVFEKLKEIGNITGQSSFAHKKNKIRGLITACVGCETRYLIRSLQKKLRIGLAEQSILVAIAHAFVYYKTPLDKQPSKEELDIAALTVKTAYCELPNYDIIINSILNNGLQKLHESCKMMPGVPVKPMLANSSKSISEILKRFDEIKISCEYKYDGERAQVA
uniref:DNA ligase 1 (Trinotate prediction) n=1 Tax=Henneguya salminicola TaxID=69463 RepID=A0A6G3MEH7_HENSL